MNIEECINYLLTQAQNKVNVLFRENLKIHEVTPAQYMLLYHLWAEDGLSPTYLATLTGLDASTITGLLTRMESKKLIKRKHSKNDRRAIHVYLTPQGAGLEDDITKVIEQSNIETLSVLSETEQSEFKDYLNRICDNAKS